MLLWDATGTYDAVTNPTGWSTPNPENTEVDVATLSFTYPGGTVPVPVDVQSWIVHPTYFTIAYQLLASAFGMSTFPDGIATFEIEISGISGGDPFTSVWQVKKLMDCAVDCCVTKRLQKIADNALQSCPCDREFIFATLEMQGLLEAARAAACCGDWTKADKLINDLKTLCSGCGCGC